ncbi:MULTISPECIES: TrkH family potassium uptake protein [Gammaproteobacteria]|uniref:TrkH family potassium uptake protein n=1 Tax=Gammaproteobacteria TaxID=1236 RepID=UPI000DD07088|nr:MULTISPECIES: TrkH family potassium uptake protein [Gammaproteobacteria]RTE86672.1 potassium transporter [Aliidiomarina sp. B3213]TCZ90775.1 potassium transporter [Lysobacter sp. N42]
MQIRTILRMLGLLVGIFSFTLLPPAVIAYFYEDGGGWAFSSAFLLSLVVGFLMWFANRDYRSELKTREGFIIVVMFWVVLGTVGAIPFWMPDDYTLTFTDAMFESFSALTTTGATVLTGIEELPHSYRFYRQQLQWMGGMGIIVLAVAILPLLGIGGLQLYRAETPGPMKDKKLTPRIADTAKQLWYIYLSMTVACAVALWLAGMRPFDAIGHAFSTVAIGGFSTHDASIGYFNSWVIDLIIVFFLLLAAVNFSLHFAAYRGKSIKTYWRDPEFKALIGIQGILMLITVLTLWWKSDLSVSSAWIDGIFQSVSISTTAGFTTTDYTLFPLFLPILLIFSSFIGGSAGSTGGGLKVIRVALLYRQGKREINRLIHPKGTFTVKWGKRALPDRVVQAVWGFFAAYALIFVVLMLGFIATGLDDYSAFGATVATLNNLGPGLGEVASNFQSVSDGGKWIAIIAMMFGRLEVFTLLVLFTPTFWKH